MVKIEDQQTRSHAWSAANPEEPTVAVLWEGGAITRTLSAGGSLVVGRGDDADVKILHLSISRRHVRINAGSPPTVEDLGSANGVRVDRQRIPANAPQVLLPGQVVEFGAAMLVLQGGSANVPPARDDADRFVGLVAKSRLSILILGETGSGKEVMAERIHRASPRSDGPFVRLNVAAFTETLLESELFGHERGAFTGATQTKRGLIESAHQGTLLLDEVSEMPLSAQAKLLRVLETREVRRVGAVSSFGVDVRILSATNRDMTQFVAEGRFRQDLLYRLNGVSIKVPPLRERKHLIPGLAEEFLREGAEAAGVSGARITPAALAALQSHAWPGNVRELRNVVERAFVLSEGAPIEPRHLLLGEPPPHEPNLSLREGLAVHERERIVQALAATNGNQTRAAAALGLSRRALINRLETFDLPRPRKKKPEE